MNQDLSKLKRSLGCPDWAPEKEPQPIFDLANGSRCIGMLMPVDPEVIARSPGIQPWSRPQR